MTATVEAFSLPLTDPLRTAHGTIERRDGFLVRLAATGQRPSGLGEATPLPGWTESTADCRAALERAVEDSGGHDGLARPDPTGRPAASHAVALAVADRSARRAGVPLYRHLGAGGRVKAVAANATVADAGPEETAAEATAAVEAGFDCVKVKVGARDAAADRERVRAVREAVGHAVELRLDANGAWDAATAADALDWAADYGVALVEQPTPADALEELASLRSGPVDVAADESVVACGADAVLAGPAADALILKPMALGGVDRARDIAVRARAAGLDVVITTTVDAVVARTAAVHLAASLAPLPACGLATADRLAADLGPDPAPVEGGTASVPATPGLGIRPAEVNAPS